MAHLETKGKRGMEYFGENVKRPDGILMERVAGNALDFF